MNHSAPISDIPMEMVVEPDVYSPCVDTLGNYIDKLPNFARFANGIRCPCGGRKTQYNTSSSFSAHTKTKMHQKWLEQLTVNKTNYYQENEEFRQTIHNQKLVIARLENELRMKTRAIDYLSSQLGSFITQKECVIGNLIEFD